MAGDVQSAIDWRTLRDNLKSFPRYQLDSIVGSLLRRCAVQRDGGADTLEYPWGRIDLERRCGK